MKKNTLLLALSGLALHLRIHNFMVASPLQPTIMVTLTKSTP